MELTTLPHFSKLTTVDPRGVRLVHTPDGLEHIQRRADGTLHRPAKGYRITDPVDFAAKLEAGGFRVTQCRSLFSHGVGEPRRTRWKASPWKYCLEVAYPEVSAAQLCLLTDHGDYEPRARWLLANDGREALKFARGALRLNCTNQFTSCVLSIRHTDPDIDGIIDDPAGYMWAALEGWRETPERLTRLRGLFVPDAFYAAMDTYPRVAHRVAGELNHSYRQGDFWALAQALTASRAPRAMRASAALLAEGFPEAVIAAKDCGLLPGPDAFHPALATYFKTWTPREAAKN